MYKRFIPFQSPSLTSLERGCLRQGLFPLPKPQPGVGACINLLFIHSYRKTPAAAAAQGSAQPARRTMANNWVFYKLYQLIPKSCPKKETLLAPEVFPTHLVVQALSVDIPKELIA